MDEIDPATGKRKWRRVRAPAGRFKIGAGQGLCMSNWCGTPDGRDIVVGKVVNIKDAVQVQFTTGPNGKPRCMLKGVCPECGGGVNRFLNERDSSCVDGGRRSPSPARGRGRNRH